MTFVYSALSNTDSVIVMFVMNIDPSIVTVYFTEVPQLSSAEHEDEILFSMHAIFRIEGNQTRWKYIFGERATTMKQ